MIQPPQRVRSLNNLCWLTDAQFARLQPFFPKSHGKPRVDDRRALIGIIFINRNGLRWSNAPKEYGPPKTLYNRWKRRRDKGIRPCIPGRKSRGTPVKHDKRRSKRRNHPVLAMKQQRVLTLGRRS